MVNRNKGNHSVITWEDRYFDGEIDYYDERYVSLDWKNSTSNLINYQEEMLDTYDDDILWLKNEAQKKYYREPYKQEEIEKAVIK